MLFKATLLGSRCLTVNNEVFATPSRNDLEALRAPCCDFQRSPTPVSSLRYSGQWVRPSPHRHHHLLRNPPIEFADLHVAVVKKRRRANSISHRVVLLLSGLKDLTPKTSKRNSIHTFRFTENRVAIDLCDEQTLLMRCEGDYHGTSPMIEFKASMAERAVVEL